MAPPDNLHSHVVAWLKVILPLSALALLSTVFLVARQGGGDAELPFSEADLEEMASEQRVEHPEFAGLTREGRRIEISADSAVPRDSEMNVVDATRIRGRLDAGESGIIDLVSDAGTMFSADSRTILRGDVLITTTTGYTMRTDELIAAMDRTEMETTGPVSADGPLGQIDAGRMELVEDPRDEEALHVVFKDGVKLIYLPQARK